MDPWESFAARTDFRVAVLTGLLSLLFAAPSALSVPGHPAAADFKYYVLSFYWLPTLCLESPSSDFCQGPRHGGFVVAGLRPMLDWNSPLRCGSDDALSTALISSLKDLLPTPQLVQQQWHDYGTCSGLDPQGFFVLLREAYASVKLPVLGDSQEDIQQTTRQITKAFRNRDNGLFEQSIPCSAPKIRRASVSEDLPH